jgi:hypothetical protein
VATDNLKITQIEGKGLAGEWRQKNGGMDDFCAAFIVVHLLFL